MSPGWFLIAGVLILGMPCAVAISANECTPPSSGPDAVVMDVVGNQYWATIDGISAYSFGSDILNKGDSPLPWNGQVGIAQNAYRLKNSRFEQIGMSWVKVVGAVATDSVYCNCIPPGSPALGIGCSDVYEATTNGSQPFLGPRSAVNAHTGTIPSLGGSVANALERRLQVPVSDLDPALNLGALYFAEIQLISPFDINAGNSYNNSSHEPRTVQFFSQIGTFAFVTNGTTIAQLPAIFAWSAADPSVNIITVDVPDEGLFYVASHASEDGAGTWQYEYAIFNLNSHRSARSFSVPVPQGITVSDIGFHDVDYHSGEPYDGTDWVGVHENGAVTWSTQSYDENPNANALRWGTLYNFRFDADAPPAATTATIELFRPGDPNTISVTTRAPAFVVPTTSTLGLVLAVLMISVAGTVIIRRGGLAKRCVAG